MGLDCAVVGVDLETSEATAAVDDSEFKRGLGPTAAAAVGGPVVSHPRMVPVLRASSRARVTALSLFSLRNGLLVIDLLVAPE